MQRTRDIRQVVFDSCLRFSAAPARGQVKRSHEKLHVSSYITSEWREYCITKAPDTCDNKSHMTKGVCFLVSYFYFMHG